MGPTTTGNGARPVQPRSHLSYKRPDPGARWRVGATPGILSGRVSEQNVELVREGFDRFLTGDYEALVEFFMDITAPDVEIHSRFTGLAGEPFRGHAGVRSWLAEWNESFERFEPWLEQVIEVDDDRVVALGGISFSARASGVDMDTPIGWIQEFSEGKLQRMRVFGSQAEALEAAGVSERSAEADRQM